MENDIPPPETLLAKLKRLGSIALGYLASLLFFSFILEGTIEGFQEDSFMKWITLGVLLANVTASVLLVMKKRSSWEIFRVTALSFVLLVVYSSFVYSTSEMRAFSLFHRPTESLLNPVFLIVLVALLLTLWIRFVMARWIKITMTGLLLYCALAFLYGIFRGVGLEEAFLGVDFFSAIPWFFLQPIYLTIHLIFPVVFVCLLFGWLKNLKKDSARARTLLGLCLLVFVTDAIGFVAMMRNRVPNVFSFIISPSVGVGEASTTFSDPTGQLVTSRITTKNFEQERNNEGATFYNMALSYKASDGDKRVFNLSVKDVSGKDVLFLDADDFVFYESDQPQEPHGIEFELGGVRTGQNVILILDHSGSMSSVMDQLKLAAKSFVDLKYRNDRILLVPFGDHPEPQPMSEDKQVLKTQIDNIGHGGGTGLYGAILLSFDLAEKLSGHSTMVVMTDGKATDANNERKNALTQKLASKKLRIYSVGLGKPTDLDEPFLKTLAQEGGGKYFQTQDAAKLKDIYQSIGAELQAKYTGWYVHQIAAPIVKITHPTASLVLTAPTSLSADVPNAVESQLSKVEFVMDGQALDTQPGSAQTTYAVPFDPAQIAPGRHSLEVIATSSKNKVGQDQVEFEVQKSAELSILRPSTEDTVTGVAKIDAELVIRSGASLTQMNFLVDGVSIGTLAQPPYSIDWDTQTVAGGKHTVKVDARLSDGTTLTQEIRVKVGKDLGMQISSPANGTELAGTVPLSIQLTSEDPLDPVASVQYSSGDVIIATVNTPPFSSSWDTANLGAGNHLLRATATTKEGKSVSGSVNTKVSFGKLIVQLEGSGSSNEGDGKAKFFFPPENVEIILDVSNSMWAQLADGTKIDIAKQVLSKIVDEIPQQTQVALRVYGNNSPVARNDCKDSELMIPLSPLNRQTILKKIEGLTPKGKTPIAFSLEQARQDLSGGKGSSVLLLITDGIESCNGDPVAAAASLGKLGIKTKVHVIGFDVANEKEGTDLARIATAGGGKYFSASSSAQLTNAIVEAVTADFRVTDLQGKIIVQAPVGGGTYELRSGTYNLSVELAPPLTLNSLLIRPNQTTGVWVQKTPSGYQLIQK